jgi:hypothetical protein
MNHEGVFLEDIMQQATTINARSQCTTQEKLRAAIT